MLAGLTGDPVRRARHLCRSTNSACSHQASRGSVSRASSHKGHHRASSTSHQAATAYAGGHGAGPCASAAAAAAAPTATQELLVQVAQEEPAQRYAQHHVDGVGGMQLHPMHHLHQLQHHDQVLLQQQLEHLHQQHRQGHQQQQPEQQQQQRQQQQSKQPCEWLPPSSTAPCQPQQEQAAPQLAAMQHPLQAGPTVHAGSPVCSAQQAVTLQPAQTPGAAAEEAASHAGPWGPVSHAEGSGLMQAPVLQLPHRVAPVTQRTGHQATELAGGASAGQPGRQNVSSGAGAMHHQQPSLLLQQQQQPCGQPRSAARQRYALGRTPSGLPLLRLRRGAKPAEVAAVLCSCLLQEQQVVLSAAGADLALLALNCLERAVALQQQQQPGALLLAVPHCRSSKRPVGGGRCQVFDLLCSVQLGMLQGEQAASHVEQQPQPQLDHGQSRLQQLGHQVERPPASPPAAGHLQEQRQLEAGKVQLQHAVIAGWQQSPCCCSSSGSVPDSPQQLADLQHQGRSDGPPAVPLWQVQLEQSAGEASAASHQHASPGKQQREQRQPKAHQQQQQPQAVEVLPEPNAVAAAAAAVAPLKVAGCSTNFADVLEDALLTSGSAAAGAVLLPVAHAKQAVRVLEAASLVNARWQRRARMQAGSALGGAAGRSSSSSSSSSAGMVLPGEMQLVLQPHRGRVPSQSGSVRGLHVFVYPAPLVQ